MVFVMRLSKLTLSLAGAAALVSIGMPGAQAAVIPGSELLATYLVIATGDGTNGSKFDSFSMSNVEIGADQELVSSSSVGAPSQRVGSFTGGLSNDGIFVENNGEFASFGRQRWDDLDPDHDGDTVGVPDRLPGARPIFEGIDYSGNVAILGTNAKFESSNADVNANLGVRCNGPVAGCLPNPSSTNSYFSDSLDVTEDDLAAGNGISEFGASEVTNLLDDLIATRDFVVGLTADTFFSSSAYNAITGLPFTTGEFEQTNEFLASLVNRNIKATGAPVITDLDAIDAFGNGDGFAVIDIDVDNNAFNVVNTDWILQSAINPLTGKAKTTGIFRMADGTYFNFNNSSVLLGDGTPDKVCVSTNNPVGCIVDGSQKTITELGAIFFTDARQGTNNVIDLQNAIMGGIGLWDFTDFNPTGDDSANGMTRLSPVASAKRVRPGDLTAINMQNAQGCAQFISHEVLMSNNRWTGCTQLAEQVPEPSAWWLMGFGLLGVELLRRTRRVKRVAA
jgi:PEP-CTERM motif